MYVSLSSILFFIVFISFYACLEGYFLLRSIGQVFGGRLKICKKILLRVYWPLSLMVCGLYFYFRYSSSGLRSLFRLASSYWGLLLFIPFFVLADILNLGAFILRKRRATLPRNIPPLSLSKKSPAVFSVVVRSAAVVLGSLTIAFGALSARYAKVTDYTVAVEKPLPQNGLRIVLVSDIHIGAMVHKKQLGRLVSKINALEGDLILIAGDIIDRDMNAYKSENLNEEMSKLKARLGVYAAPGNHDYFEGNLEELERRLAAAGVKLLVDEAILLDGADEGDISRRVPNAAPGENDERGAFYVIGRNDFSAGRRGAERKPLQELTENLDASLPLIVMDHQPRNLGEAEAAGIDLQMSGHTHRGQIWPGPLFTKRLYELDYGLLRKGKTAFITTSGCGTWGPPVRLGTRSEIVCIELKESPGYNTGKNTAEQ